MEVRDSVIRRVWHDAAIEELVLQLRKKGYVVEREVLINGTRPDLVARRGEETLVFEVQTGPVSKLESERLQSMRKAIAGMPNAQFRLVWSGLPQRKVIEVEGLESILTGVLIDESAGTDLDSLATHHWVEEVADVVVTSIQVRKAEVRCSGSGVVDVSFQQGSDADQESDIGMQFSHSFPFKFDVSLKGNLSVTQVHGLHVDVSEFYE